MARTPNDVLKARVGELMFENAELQSQNESLKEKLIEVGRMLPPEKLEELKLKIVEPSGNGEAESDSPEA